jgi:hypothetical protein
MGARLPTQRYLGHISISTTFEHKAEPSGMLMEGANDRRKMKPKNSIVKREKSRSN